MILTYNPGRNIFVMSCTRDESAVVKENGFRWCSGSCEARWKCLRCGEHGAPGGFARSIPGSDPAWWTARAEVAARFLEVADAGAMLALDRAIAQQRLSQASDADIAIPAPAGRVYRGFQRAGVAYVRQAWSRFKGALIADDMGLGKTVQALGAINADPSIRRVLILCPKSLQINWLREAERWLIDKEEPWKCYLAEESLPVPAEANLAIVNYDKLVGRPGQVVAPSLVAHGKWDLVIYDEAHYCKNPKAARTEVALKGIPPASRRLLFLTGTPIENRPIELHPILEACAPEEFPFWDFAKRFCDAHEEWVGGGRSKKRVWKFTGHSNLEELNARLRGTVMVRRLKGDVLAELPAKIRQVIELDAGDAEGLIEEENELAARHPELAEGFSGQVSGLAAGASVAFTELARIRHDLGMAKLGPACDWIIDALEGNPGKMIVFAHHLDVIDGIMERLREAKIGGVVRVDGRVAADERQKAVDEFQNPTSGIRVFVGQTSAAGVGLTLTAASRVAFVESDWVPGKITQAEDRAHRIGQTDSVNVYHLAFNRSLDARMLQTIIEKQNVQDAALDSKIAVVLPPEPHPDALARGAGVEPEKKTYPVASFEERTAATKALRILSENCDGARQQDGAGFNKLDSRFGKELAAKRLPLTDGQVFAAKKLIRKYRRQIPAELLEVLFKDDEDGVLAGADERTEEAS